jgi:hypothetical protein
MTACSLGQQNVAVAPNASSEREDGGFAVIFSVLACTLWLGVLGVTSDLVFLFGPHRSERVGCFVCQPELPVLRVLATKVGRSM